MRTDSKVNHCITDQETRQKSAISTGYVHVQPAERAERTPFWYKSLKVPSILFAFMTSCGSRQFRDAPQNETANLNEPQQFHLQILVIYKLGINQNDFMFTLILLITIVLCSKFP